MLRAVYPEQRNQILGAETQDFQIQQSHGAGTSPNPVVIGAKRQKGCCQFPMRLNGDAVTFPVKTILAVIAGVPDVVVCFEIVVQIPQNMQAVGNISLMDEKIQIPETPQSNVAINRLGQQRPLEGHSRNATFLQRSENADQLDGELLILFALGKQEYGCGAGNFGGYFAGSYLRESAK